jgi:hypothetical protein
MTQKFDSNTKTLYELRGNENANANNVFTNIYVLINDSLLKF